MWAEANTDLVCNNDLERMASIHESAVCSDVLMSGGEHQLGLEIFARTAACAANPDMRYEFAKYRNPWASRKETPAVDAIRKGWKRQASWTKRARDRIALLQQCDDALLATQTRRRGAPKGAAKKVAKRKAAAPKQATKLPLPM